MLEANAYSMHPCWQHRLLVKVTSSGKMIEKVLAFIKFAKTIISDIIDII